MNDSPERVIFLSNNAMDFSPRGSLFGGLENTEWKEKEVSSQRMATPSRPRKNDTGASSMAKRTATRRSKSQFNLKQALTTTALWALGILNVILIVSFVSKHFLSGREHAISAEAEMVTPENLKIEVLNGCGVDGLARKYADLFKQHGFDPVNVATYERLDLPRTYIIDRRSKEMANALQIAKILGLPDVYVSYQQAKPDRMVSVSVILGQDYKTIPANPK